MTIFPYTDMVVFILQQFVIGIHIKDMDIVNEVKEKLIKTLKHQILVNNRHVINKKPYKGTTGII